MSLSKSEQNFLSELKKPFPPEKIHWRVGATNTNRDGSLKWGDKPQCIALAYINARDVMKRLDDVMGLDWQNRYPYEGCCEIGLRIDGEWLWRSNGAGETEVEGEKGRYSDAFKRAAVNWGIGRYLYYLPQQWVAMENKKIKTPPKLPSWAIPAPTSKGSNVDIVELARKGLAIELYIYNLKDKEDFEYQLSQIPTGKKGELKRLVAEVVKLGYSKYLELQDAAFKAFESADDLAFKENIEGLSDTVKLFLKDHGEQHFGTEFGEYL